MKYTERKNEKLIRPAILIVLLIVCVALFHNSQAFADLDLSDDLDLGDGESAGTLTPPSPPLPVQPSSPTQPGAITTSPPTPLNPTTGPLTTPPVANPSAYPQGMQCPPGTTWLSGQCVPIGSPPSPPIGPPTVTSPPVMNPSGYPVGMNCPPGTTFLSGQCVPVGIPPQVAAGARPLAVENRTQQIMQIWLFQPGNFTSPYLQFPINPGRGELTNPDRTALAITPEWGIAAQTADQSLSWPLRTIRDYRYEVDPTGHYFMIFSRP